MKLTDQMIKHMVDRFLGWRLPENFNPDCGISFKKAFNEDTAYPMKHEPSGTNLFDATQAEEMVRYMIDGAADLSRAEMDVLAECARQISSEGYTEAHDDHHYQGELATAGACYARMAFTANEYPPSYWPWLEKEWKPKNPRRDLVRAAALIIAEIKRIDRLDARLAIARELTGPGRPVPHHGSGPDNV